MCVPTGILGYLTDPLENLGEGVSDSLSGGVTELYVVEPVIGS